MPSTRRYLEAVQMLTTVSVSRLEEFARSAARAPVETASEAADSVSSVSRAVIGNVIEIGRASLRAAARTATDLGRSVRSLDPR